MRCRSSIARHWLITNADTITIGYSVLAGDTWQRRTVVNAIEALFVTGGTVI